MTMSHNKSPEKVGHNELLELSETTKDIEMRLKDVMKSCRAETTPKSLESCYSSTPKPSDPKVPLFSRPREVTASYDLVLNFLHPDLEIGMKCLIGMLETLDQ